MTKEGLIGKKYFKKKNGNKITATVNDAIIHKVLGTTHVRIWEPGVFGDCMYDPTRYNVYLDNNFIIESIRMG